MWCLVRKIQGQPAPMNAPTLIAPQPCAAFLPYVGSPGSGPWSDGPAQKRQTAASEERERVQRRVEGFDWQKSPTWLHLSCLYGPKLKQDELVSIAEICAQKLEIRLDRDARRRKVVMIKWFEENWFRIRHVLPFIVLDN
jgi:hypothetical protein